MNCTQRDIKNQFARVVKEGWLGWFQGQAERVGATTALLLGVGSRETNLKNIRGDFRNDRYNGFGILQVDIGTDREYARHWSPDLVEPGIRRGAEIWRDKMGQVVTGEGKTLRFKGREFVGKNTAPDDDRRIATAAYNCGLWAYYHFSRGRHVDSTTTGHDYSRDVYDRAVEFAELLQEGGYEANAVQRELKAQGKYARRAHRERFKVFDLPERVQLLADVPQEAEEVLAQADYHQDAPEETRETVEIPAAVLEVAPAVSVAPVVGGASEDKPVQVSNGWLSRVYAAIGGSGTLAAIVSGIQGNRTGLILGGVVCLTVIILAVIFRGVILDWLRLKVHADPTKQNVR